MRAIVLSATCNSAKMGDISSTGISPSGKSSLLLQPNTNNASSRATIFFGCNFKLPSSVCSQK